MKRLLVGPVLDTPSWHWCGGDLLKDFRKHFEVATFRRFDEDCLPSYDVLLIVKQPPSFWVSKRGKVAYLPVDYFTSQDHVDQTSSFLRSCDVVMVHSRRLTNPILQYCPTVSFVEHYAKYVLPSMRDYVPKDQIVAGRNDFVLWTGHDEYADLAINWYAQRPRLFPLRLTTNRWRRILPPGITWQPWSEETQKKLFKTARAGLDVKNETFYQMTKPPTKVQQFVASGIPCAATSESYAWEYFHVRGLDLVSPDNEERWFSREYWEETRVVGLALRKELSRQEIARSYIECLKDL